jgi:integrase
LLGLTDCSPELAYLPEYGGAIAPYGTLYCHKLLKVSMADGGGQVGRWPDLRLAGADARGPQTALSARPTARAKSSTARRSDVQDSVEDVLKKQQDGLPIHRNERQTLGQFLRTWLEDVAKPSTRPSTYRGYEQKLRVHVLSNSLARMQLSQVTPQEVQAFLNEKHRAGQSAQSVQHLRAILRTALSTAVKWGFVPRNAAALADGPRVIHREVQAPTPAEARTLLEAVRGDRLEALYTVALAIGVRQGEALGLCWKDVDLDAGNLSVRTALQRRKGGFDLVEPKTTKSRRTVALPAVAVKALTHHHERQEFERKKLQGDPWGNDWDLVFTTAEGKPLHGTEVTHLFQRLLRKAGLPHQRFHDLCHACASLLLAQGEHPRVVMETLAHSMIALTMNTYSHVMPQLQREAAAKMDAVLSPKRPA